MLSAPSPEVLPESQHEAVAEAIRWTFGDEAPASLEPIHGGLSGARVLKLLVAGEPYVLRVLPAPSALNDPKRHFTCMTIAAEQGLAPPVLFADDATGLCITRYIPTQPTATALHADLTRVDSWGDMLRRLHTGPAFPASRGPFQMIHGVLAMLQGAHYPLPERVQTLRARFDALQEELQPHLTSVPCHNDLNPGNLLFDGARLWLVDWETACMGEPFLELATALLWFNFSAEEEERMLRAYWRAEPTPWQRAKLELMKQVARFGYSVVFLMVGLREGKHPPESLPEPARLPSLKKFLRAVGAGTYSLHNSHDRFLISIVLAHEALVAMERPEYAQAVHTLRTDRAPSRE